MKSQQDKKTWQLPFISILSISFTSEVFAYFIYDNSKTFGMLDAESGDNNGENNETDRRQSRKRHLSFTALNVSRTCTVTDC